MNTRDTIARLQALAEEGDALMARVIDELKDHAECMDDLEHVERLRSVAMVSSASFIVESKALIEEIRNDAATLLFGKAAGHTWHQ